MALIPFHCVSVPEHRQPKHCACGEHAWVSLTRGLVAFIDPADVELVASVRWHAVRRGHYFYAVSDRGRHRGRRLRKCVGMHQLIFGTAKIVDHRDRNSLNNRKANLRTATVQKNAWNADRAGNGVVPYIGVDRKDGLYRSRYRHSGHQIEIGTFETASAAALAYDAAILVARGEFAVLNFPELRHSEAA